MAMIMTGNPFTGKELEQLKNFLQRMDLTYDEAIEYSVCMMNSSYEIIATGSLDHNVIKCVAVDPDYQGQGFSSTVITQLMEQAFQNGQTHLMIYTKLKNIDMFSDMGFYPILETADVLFMENKRNGFGKFLAQLKKETQNQTDVDKHMIHGCIVANCNPFTKGHLYLIEQALEQCDFLHLFVLSDNRSTFSAKERWEMVKAGITEIKGFHRIILHKTSNYMISAATFPTYFYKDKQKGEAANCKLDIELFATKIAPELGITKRFVGTEPFCVVTKAYNDALKSLLPKYGVEFVEVKRLEVKCSEVTHLEMKRHDEDGIPVSASLVRNLIEKKDFASLKFLVPESTYKYVIEQNRFKL